MSLVLLRNVATFAAVAVVVPSTAAFAQAQLRGPQWPLTVQDVKPPVPDEASPTSAWSPSEIAEAKARCNAVVTKYSAVIEPIDPIRDGDCGTPYPVKLTRLGKVTLSQPATLNCDMVAAVGDWMKQDVQPAAKRLLNQRITGIEVLSSYSCRNAYGRKHTRLSEHARANALDIKGFIFERAGSVEVLADWGMTDREIKAKIAAAERAAEKMAAAKAEAEARAKAVASARTDKNRQITAVAPSLTEHQAQQSGIGLVPSADGLSAFRGFVSTTIKGEDDDERSGSAFTWGQPSRLGGPKERDASTQPAKKPQPQSRLLAVDENGHNARQRFLRDVHDSACKRFGTALGPEANQAHRNHLHIDLADRGAFGSYCR
ncbi:MAG: extensin family protein [Hyphomicrobiaceae bacterium]